MSEMRLIRRIQLSYPESVNGRSVDDEGAVKRVEYAENLSNQAALDSRAIPGELAVDAHFSANLVDRARE